MLVLGVAVAPSASAASNDETAFDYVVSKGLTERQSAGIVGNLIQESSSPINPYADQAGGPGMGIAQWSSGGSTTETSLPVLRNGSTGSAVRTVQSMLRASGRSVTADGIFGSGTESAVRSYQSEVGLVVDGVVGNNTWGSLVD